MANKIAAVLRDGQLSDYSVCTQVVIFEQTGDSWQIADEFPCTPNTYGTPAEIRNDVRSLILQLMDCSIIVARRLQGLPYHVFDRMGFQIFETEGLSYDLLNAILADILAANDVSASIETPIAPTPTAVAGTYALNLIALLEKHPEISSKKRFVLFCKTPLLSNYTSFAHTYHHGLKQICRRCDVCAFQQTAHRTARYI